MRMSPRPVTVPFATMVPMKYIAKPAPARMPVMIQKRTMTFVSDHPFISKW